MPPSSTETTTQSGKEKRPKTPCVTLLKPHEKLKGNRILDIAQIQNIVQEHMVCKKCAEKKETKLLDDLDNFATYLDSLEGADRNKSAVEKLGDFKAKQKKSLVEGKIRICREEQYGIATRLELSCFSSDGRV